MVVDDSAVIRGLLTRALESDGGISVVVSASNGQMALDSIARHDIELVLLDVEMPVMDGLTALPLLLKLKPQLKVIVVSSLTRGGATATLRALAAGAADYVTKPSSAALTNREAFRHELIAKVKGLIEARRVGAAAPAPEPSPVAPGGAMRPLPLQAPEAIAIGASTGGPMALYRVTAALRLGVRQPIFITQHMPPTFTAIFAEHVSRTSGLAAAEAIDGERVAERRIYVAPGDFHMLIEGGRVRLVKGPAENYCRPAVDPMLRSLSQAYGPGLLTVILTGMGQDGLGGAHAAVAAGGTVIAQDKATSVVWGMPGAVAQAGLCAAILPLDEIGPFLAGIAARGAA
jgi:two-component system chemotaxis response regulator CheB